MSVASKYSAGSLHVNQSERNLPKIFPVSAEHMQQIDREAIHTVGIPRLLLMEHAGLALALATQQLLQHRKIKPSKRLPILVCCGMGYNGGDGLSAARHLLQWGFEVRIMLLGDFNALRNEPAIFAKILKRLKVRIISVKTQTLSKSNKSCLERACLYIDALLGIGARGSVRKPIFDVIKCINQFMKPVISADIPSGLDANTGRPRGISIKADCTISFGQPKKGCYTKESQSYVGALSVDPITIPRYLLSKKIHRKKYQ